MFVSSMGKSENSDNLNEHTGLLETCSLHESELKGKGKGSLAQMC